MPLTLTPDVMGQALLSSRAAHGSLSITSFAPAANTCGCLGLTATAGSFWAFSGNRVEGPPTVTRLSAAASTGWTGPSKVRDSAINAQLYRQADEFSMRPPTPVRRAYSERPGGEPYSYRNAVHLP